MLQPEQKTIGGPKTDRSVGTVVWAVGLVCGLWQTHSKHLALHGARLTRCRCEC